MFNLFRKSKDIEEDGKWTIDRQEEETKAVPDIKRTKICILTGNEKSDYLYFLVKLGLAAGKKILVVDNSFEHGFFELIKDESGSAIRNRDGLVVCADYRVDKSGTDLFDNVFVWLGHNYKGAADYIPDCTIYIATQVKYDISCVKNAASYIDSGETAFILRDVCTKKITAQSAKSMIGITSEYTYSVPLDAGDMAAYIALTHNGTAPFRQLSNGIYGLMVDMGEIIYELNERQCKRLMKG